MLKEKKLLTKLIPVSIIIVCVAVVSRFFTEPFKFPINYDDCLYNALLKNHSIWELVQMMSGKYTGQYLCHFDGRIFSNIYLLLVFNIIKTHVSIYYLYNLFIFTILAVSFYFLFHSLIKKGIISKISFEKEILFSLFISCTLFIFLIDGRYEVFYWVSSTGNHLLSIIIFIFALTLFIGDRTFFKALLLSILSFCLGQMNEVYAMCYLLIFLVVALYFPKTKISFLIVFIMFASGLLINILSSGTMARVNTIGEYSSHFNFKLSLIDTIDTFWLPIINFRYLPIKIPIVILLFISVRHYIKIQVPISDNFFYTFNRLILVISIVSIFLHCYILGEICTYRGLLFYCLSLIYFIFVMAVKNILNPLKLFKK